ncbi:NAD(P)H-binding protein [Actinacidiphila bryophytorum]|uniref:NmrA family transcriptional regulator n=1 Tax=Actinacidiphila bryophytorum TaxID=1436133 RepID=A0A9W4MGC0_9ACTN|nr:NAD(P)H-binding protein [Actinacidiphila bryophytorum]MBM9440596.1 NAD(P)H-binding protein [Actinacidiphila bryophytorum]MBN6543179.1 NAD(P)H-binding protein [Actinacidiphila bryophytorum]CAG7645261.1 NmrA family transcriptional regulator [Actinacidiphila bryophytorum]
MIVVTTPTGSIGHQTLARVIDAGAPVRVIARDPSRLAPEVRERAEVVKGSSDDPGAVSEACVGADAVLWVLPPDPRAASLHGHVIDFTRPLCDAIAAHGVQRVVGVSSLGRGTARNAGQISAVFAMDHLIESTGVHYRSLAMPGFMENVLRQLEPITRQGVFYGQVAGDRKGPACATRDIAATAARLLLDDTWTGQEEVPLPGPEDLSPDDMAAVMAEVLGRPVAYRRVPAEGLRADLVGRGVSPAWAQGLVAMGDAVEAGIYGTGEYASRSASPTTFRQWCQDVLRPAAEAAA